MDTDRFRARINHESLARYSNEKEVNASSQAYGVKVTPVRHPKCSLKQSIARAFNAFIAHVKALFISITGRQAEVVVLKTTPGLIKSSTVDNDREEKAYANQFEVCVFEPMPEHFQKDPRFDSSSSPVFDDNDLDEGNEEALMDEERIESESAVSDQASNPVKKESVHVPSQKMAQPSMNAIIKKAINTVYNELVKQPAAQLKVGAAENKPVNLLSSSERMTVVEGGLKAFLEESDAKFKRIDEERKAAEALKAEALEVGAPIPLSKSDEGIEEPAAVTSDDDSDEDIFYDRVCEQETAKASRSIGQEDEGYVSDLSERT